MGSILSCCGLGDAEEDDHNKRQTERTPLLQDPTAILQQPRPEPTPADQQRDQEALARIVDRTAENLVNIQSTFDWRKNGQNMDAAEKAAHFKYLIDRLQNDCSRKDSNASQDSLVETRHAKGHHQQDDDTAEHEGGEITLATTAMTDAERQLLDTTVRMFQKAVEEEMQVKPVGKVFVKLNWD